jgi:hypothetical protein
MEKIAEIAKFLTLHGPELIAALSALLSAIIAIALLIPGDQPEKALQGVVDFLAKFSRKKE